MEEEDNKKRKRRKIMENTSNKRRKISNGEEEEDYSNGAMETTSNKRRIALFDKLPDDLVLIIVFKLGAIASCPADFFNLHLTCKRLNELALDPSVLSKLSPNVFACRARKLGRKALLFVMKCVQATNLEAIYTLGMIRFYIYGDYKRGKHLLRCAARKHHLLASYSIAIIHFNGSGGTKNRKAALKYLVRAANSGHVDAIRELGNRIWEVFSLSSWNDSEEWRRILFQATAREIVSRLPPDTIEAGSAGRGKISIPVPKSPCLRKGKWLKSVPRGPRLAGSVSGSDLTIMSDFGWDIPDPIPHPANCLLTEWFKIRGGGPGNGLRLCSRLMCGRPETYKDEFLKCPLCRVACYCSQTCKSADWKKWHHIECMGNNVDEENDVDVALDEI